MADAIIRVRCSRCLGTGIDGNNPGVPVSCSGCGGDGWVDGKYMVLDTSSIMDAIGDVLDKCNDIKEKVDEIKAKVDTL